MKKSIKRTFVFGFVFAMFSIFACLGGVFSSRGTADAAVVNTIEIKSAEDLYNRVTNYGSTGAISNYILTKDIDMKDYVLHSTIGNEENPFRGTFDGRGFKISNLTVDMSKNLQGDEVTSTSKYVGLFGLTDGATISNIAFAGTTNLTIGQCTTAYVGTLVGSARNTQIKYIQNGSSVKLGQQTFGYSLIFGGLVGNANSTNISYVISRQTEQMKFDFVDNNGRISTLGGVVGSLSESSLVFGVSKTNLSVTIGENFEGTVNVGGVFGTVSGSSVVDQIPGTAVKNMVVENALTLTNNQTNVALGKVYVGQVGGAFVSPYPPPLGVSSVYYRKNASSITAFGATNGHVFSNPTTFDNVLETSLQFVNESIFRDSSLRWQSPWDFEKIWYFNSSTIYLQSFMPNGFSVKLSSDLLNSSIFKIEKTMQEKYFYESTAEIVFSFKTSESGINLSKYYTLTGLKQGNTDNKVTFDCRDGVYSVSSDLENYEISEKDGIYTVTIKNVNNSTAGTYDLNCEAKQFTVEATSRLYNAEGVLQDSPEPPGNLFYVGGTTDFKTLNIIMIYNGPARTIETRLRNSNLPYALEGWYLEKDGGDVLLSTANTLEIKFGTGEWTENRKIYAKYINDACKINFDIKGDGIAEIYVGENKIAGKVATVSKTASRLKLEIYVKEGFKFDVKRFLDMISTYRGKDTTQPFCTWANEESGDKKYYVFNLDMTALNKEEFADEFSIIIDTEKTGGKSNNMIWYIVGGVGGAVVLGVAIFLIIFFVKRKGTGGGKMGGYGGGRKSFKGGYY